MNANKRAENIFEEAIRQYVDPELFDSDDRNKTIGAIEKAITAAIEAERKRCALHADIVARTSALLPPNDPDRDGPKVARHIERLIKDGA